MRANVLTPVIAVLALAATGPAFAADPPPAVPAAAPTAAPSGVTLSATLTGANEVDAQGASKGDPDGTGSFSARLTKDQICYTLTSAKIDDPTMAHIHKGAAGVNGPVFIGLSDLDPGEHCEDLDPDRMDALKSKPQDYYVNIHNGDFPGGAVRGQLSKK